MDGEFKDPLLQDMDDDFPSSAILSASNLSTNAETDRQSPSKSQRSRRKPSPQFYSTMSANQQDEDHQPLLQSSQQKPQNSEIKRRKKWFRSKCCYVTIAVILLLLLLAFLITWFVIIPKVAASKLKQVQLQLNSLVLQHPRPSSVDLQVNLTMSNLEGATSFGNKISVDACTLVVKFNGTEVGNMPMPALQITKGQQSLDLVYNATMQVTNEDWFAQNVKDLLAKPKIYWELQAPAGLTMSIDNTLHLHGIEFGKDLALGGLQNFTSHDGVVVHYVEFPNNLNWQPGVVNGDFVDPDIPYQGIEVDASISLPNPSQMTMMLPDTTFSLHYKSPMEEHRDWPEIPVGLLSAVSSDMVIRPWPAENKIQMHGAVLSWDTLPSSLKSFIDESVYREVLGSFFTIYVQGQSVQMSVRGFSFTNEFYFLGDGVQTHLRPVDPPLWLLNPMSAMQINITTQNNPERGTVEVQELKSLSMNFKISKQQDGSHLAPVLSGLQFAKLFVPFKFLLNVVQARQDLLVWSCDNDICTHDVNRHYIGRLTTQYDSSVTFEHDADPAKYYKVYNVTVAMTDSKLIVPKESFRTYKEFVRGMMLKEQVKVYMNGTVSANIDMGLGLPLYVTDLTVNQDVELRGMLELLRGGPQGIKTVQNLDVYSVERGGLVKFRLAGAYMRKFSNWTMGIELFDSSQFDFFYKPYGVNDDKLVHMGNMIIPSLSIGSSSDCQTEIFDPLMNTTWQVPEGTLYCPITTEGEFVPIATDTDQEICEDKMKCASRRFLSAYITNLALHGEQSPDYVPPTVTLQATKLLPDLELAQKDMLLPDLEITGYRPSYNRTHRPPFPFLRRMVVQPTEDIIFGRLSGWLDLYNPLRVPIRYYYMDVACYVGDKKIGSMQANWTNYDPFANKPGYEFRGYPSRKTNHRKDPYGPHASGWCMKQQDCQIAPIDLHPNAVDGEFECTDGFNINSTISERVEVTFSISEPSVYEFWKSLWHHDGIEFEVRMEGRVLVAMNSVPFTGPKRLNNTNPPSDEEIDMVKRGLLPADKIDPYHFGVQDFSSSTEFVTWLDFGQDNTTMIMRRFVNGESGKPEPLHLPIPGC